MPEFFFTTSHQPLHNFYTGFLHTVGISNLYVWINVYIFTQQEVVNV